MFLFFFNEYVFWYFANSMKRLRAHIICTHPEMPREDMEKLTGYKHKTQGKLGKTPCLSSVSAR